ncbi:hypothetical protein SAMN05444487_10680 [Marininema mesophilum]|uniref:Uncharacterized protein n=1 Tax=Marininema mesophilum TaxID=1048340 RepID=A0A1H2WBT9_9BACL|nr:hypothetical protein [Marininema mesophilum]SDW78070.1 hypothetical protein SAMN05444487_10680 [Marininema mesophilum]
MLKELKKRNEKENDLYITEVVSDKIVINNEYKGLKILDNDLETINIIDVFDDIAIHSVFINNKESKLILNCPDNDSVVYVDLKNDFLNVIKPLNRKIFVDVHSWVDGGFILIDSEGSLFKFNNKSQDISNINSKELPFHLNDLNKYKKTHNNIYKIDQNVLHVMNLAERNLFSINIPDKFDVHDIIVYEDISIIVSEDCILVYKGSEKIDVLKPDSGFIFMRVSFLPYDDKYNKVAVTSSEIKNNYNSYIYTYRIII